MTSVLEELWGDVLFVRRKRNRTGNLLSRASRVARGVPEVMVKITGFGKNAAHIQSHFDYISRKGDVSLETDSGEHLDNREDIGQYFGEWQEKGKTELQRQRHNRRETLHLVLSMPAHVDSESVRKASRSFGQDVFGNHEYAFALHTDSNNPHCHLVIRMTDRDGRRINPRKADLQHWREVFAEKIREQGYEAEATSRRARGITRKREKSAIWHIESAGKTQKPRISKVRASRIRETVSEMTGGTPAGSRPWEKAIHSGQARVRRSWLLLAEELDKHTKPEDANLSRRIREMVAAMPPVETGRYRTKRKLLEGFEKNTEKTMVYVLDMPKKQSADRDLPKKREGEQDLER